MFRLSSTFCDGICYGLIPEKQGMEYIELERDKRFPSPDVKAAGNGIFIRIFFPDTESLLTECLLCLPSRIGDKDITLVANADIEAIPSGTPNKNLIVPSLILTGPGNIQKGLPAEIRISAGAARAGLESLLWINVDSDNGVMPLRRFQLATGEERLVAVRTEGLEVGDTVRVTAGIDSFKKLTTHVLTITEEA